MVNAIKSYLLRGLSIMPIRPRDKRPPAGLAWEPYAQSRSQSTDWNNWWRQYGGNMNVAVIYANSVVPDGTQLCCVDTDSEEAEAWVAAQELPATPTVRTAKGFHRYFLAPTGLSHYAGSDTRPEIRCGVHYSLLPPSIHPSGAVYAWVDGLALDDVDFAPLPNWGVALMKKPHPRPQEPREVDTTGGQTLHEGGRNRGLFEVCCRWRATDVPEQELRQAAHAYNRNHCSPALDDSEVDTIVGSALKYPAGTRLAVMTRRYEPAPLAATPSAPEPQEPPRAAIIKPGGLVVDSFEEMVTSFEQYRNLPRVVRGLRSGFPALDSHFLGFSRFPMIVVQGPSGYGKTTFATHCLFSTALAEFAAQSDKVTAIILLESTKKQLLSKYLGYRWSIPDYLREPGSEEWMTPEWESRMMEGYAEFAQLPLWIRDDEQVKNMPVLEAQLFQLAEQFPLTGIIIDHAQEVIVPHLTNRHDQVSYVATRVRDIAEQINVPIMVLSQTKLKDGEFVPEYSAGLTQKAFLSFVVTRGTPGMKREDAVQSTVTRVTCDKARDWKPSPMLLLQGDWNTGRLTEVEEDPEERREAVSGMDWPGN